MSISIDTVQAYMPLELRAIKSFRQVSSERVDSILKVEFPALKESRLGNFYTMYNRDTAKDWQSTFSYYEYPGFRIQRDRPVPCIILDWSLIYEDGFSTSTVVGAGKHSDSVLVFKVTPDTEYESITLWSAADTLEGFRGHAILMAIDSTSNPGTILGYVFVNEAKRVKTLYCVDLLALSIKWSLKVAGGIHSKQFYTTPFSDRLSCVFTTACPDNGMRDANFNDFYSYFVVCDTSGTPIVIDTIGRYPDSEQFLAPTIKDGLYYISHFDFVTTPPETEPDYFLSVIATNGAVLKTVDVPHVPAHLWTGPFGRNDSSLFVTYNVNRLDVFNEELSLQAVVEFVGSPQVPVGIIASAADGEDYYLFERGIYDADFSQVAAIPQNLIGYSILQLDDDGGCVDIALNYRDSILIASIRRKSNLELASVFYHRNQEYVLMLLSGLLVGLVVVNVYRRKTKANLKLIATQKAELEKTHKDLKEAQDRLIAAEKYKQAKDIAGGFAHEIRNALFPADSLLTKLAMRAGETASNDEQVTGYHRSIQQAVGRAIDITELISRYTKLEGMFRVEACDIEELVSLVVSDNEIRIRQHKVIVDIDISGSSTIVLDKSLMRIALSNLVANSLDATMGGEKPRIEISTRYNGGVHYINVKDNGAGISPDHVNRVMEPFFSTKGVNGTGLGLPISKRIVEMHEGSLAISNDDAGGTIATIRIPQRNKQGN